MSQTFPVLEYVQPQFAVTPVIVEGQSAVVEHGIPALVLLITLPHLYRPLWKVRRSTSPVMGTTNFFLVLLTIKEAIAVSAHVQILRRARINSYRFY